MSKLKQKKYEPIKIKFGGKFYQVLTKKELPGGVVGYIIEDETGHYDTIINPEEIFYSGYTTVNNILDK